MVQDTAYNICLCEIDVVLLQCRINNVRARYTLFVGGGLRERRRSRSVVLTTKVTLYLNVYSTMFEHQHSHIGVDDGIQTYIQENIACNDKQELQHTMM